MRAKATMVCEYFFQPISNRHALKGNLDGQIGQIHSLKGLLILIYGPCYTLWEVQTRCPMLSLLPRGPYPNWVWINKGQLCVWMILLAWYKKHQFASHRTQRSLLRHFLSIYPLSSVPYINMCDQFTQLPRVRLYYFLTVFPWHIYYAQVVSVNRTVIRSHQYPHSLRWVLLHESADIFQHWCQGDGEEGVSAPILEWGVLIWLEASDS